MQLVACVNLTDAGPDIGTCAFENPTETRPFREGRYTVVLYEAATHRLVAGHGGFDTLVEHVDEEFLLHVLRRR